MDGDCNDSQTDPEEAIIMSPKQGRRAAARTSWDGVAEWYAGWVGPRGSEYHRRVVVPAVLRLLAPTPGEQILDLGAGPGVLAPYIAAAGAEYTGVDASPRLLEIARRRHGRIGRFVEGDVARLAAARGIYAESFDGVVFMLSIQDMEPLDAVLRSAAWALRPGGRVVILMTHPCFRVPRQSGWGWDRERKLQYRRVDRYLTPLAVPMKRYGREGEHATRSFHRPLAAYVNGLSACGLLIDCVEETPACAIGQAARTAAEEHADEEIPLFLGLRAWKKPRP